jgi:small subunit ribosomal protein S11
MIKNNDNLSSKEIEKPIKIINEAIIYIQATMNNTIVTITETKNNNILANSSGGKLGYKNTRKAIPDVANQVMVDCLNRAIEKYQTKYKKNLEYVEIRVKDVGIGRSAAVKAVCSHKIKSNVDLKITRIIDTTPKAFGGCRKRKAKRN